jgi:alanine racemase
VSTVAARAALRPTHAVVDLGAYRRNLQAIALHVAPTPVKAVVKANAYGHGLVPVAAAAVEAGAARLAVAYADEALALREAGVDAPLMVLGGLADDELPALVEAGAVLAATSPWRLARIDEAAASVGRTAVVHLEIDTGMTRLGDPWQRSDLIEASLAARHVEVEGVYSHFARSDEGDLGPTSEQLARFHEALRHYDRLGVDVPPVRHIANSGAVLQLPGARLDLVRVGIASYGIYPDRATARTIDLEPVLVWRSQLVHVSEVDAGTAVSYGGTWVAPRRTRIGTVPVGYGDGYFRALSGRAEVLVAGRRVPQVGRVCMDQMMVDLGPGSTDAEGAPVVLIGTDGTETVSADDLAERAGTIAYEVLTNISARVPRVYVGGAPAAD